MTKDMKIWTWKYNAKSWHYSWWHFSTIRHLYACMLNHDVDKQQYQYMKVFIQQSKVNRHVHDVFICQTVKSAYMHIIKIYVENMNMLWLMCDIYDNDVIQINIFWCTKHKMMIRKVHKNAWKCKITYNMIIWHIWQHAWFYE